MPSPDNPPQDDTLEQIGRKIDFLTGQLHRSRRIARFRFIISMPAHTIVTIAVKIAQHGINPG